MGFEPTTFALGGRCSTVELHRLAVSYLPFYFFFYLQISLIPVYILSYNFYCLTMSDQLISNVLLFHIL